MTNARTVLGSSTFDAVVVLLPIPCENTNVFPFVFDQLSSVARTVTQTLVCHFHHFWST